MRARGITAVFGWSCVLFGLLVVPGEQVVFGAALMLFGWLVIQGRFDGR